ncbi:hypothetical protein TNCT_472361 [Trichonephila clavata]|uniref:Uncharacterized protein n=1 Tax=Trichonephila clavata TaxID=2740835 RepID=A0A8X6GHA9_TRICU|nr:hypothetical protein TNCT_472361 [Trichonephila clavata]
MRSLSEETLRYPAAYTGLTGHGKIVPHASERKISGSTVLVLKPSTPGECRALSEETLRYPAAYTGRTGHGKIVPQASERKVSGSAVLVLNPSTTR